MAAALDQPSCSKSTVKLCSEKNLTEKILDVLKPLDDLLKCHICFEYFNTCVITKCCHSYCSLCIRKYMMYRAKCPECFQETFEPELRNNRQIDQILQIYHEIRNFLGSPTLSKNDVSDCDKTIEVDVEKSKDISLNEVSKPAVSNTDGAVASGSIPAADEVACPSCSTLVLARDINFHLDMCLLRKPTSQKPQNLRKRQPLPKVVYRLLTDKEIRRRLRENGLSSAGDRETLIRRHKNFIVLYNAECDALDPRPVADIVKQLEKEEQETEKGSPVKLFQSSKKSSLKDISQENENYLRQNKNQFDALVSQIRSRSAIRCSKNKNKIATAADKGPEKFVNEIEEISISDSSEDSYGAETQRDSQKDNNMNKEAISGNELIIETSDVDGSRGNSPELFAYTESEGEISNSAKTSSFDSQDLSSSATTKKSSLPDRGCYHYSSGSSDDFRICSSMKESKRFKRKMAENDSPT